MVPALNCASVVLPFNLPCVALTCMVMPSTVEARSPSLPWKLAAVLIPSGRFF